MKSGFVHSVKVPQLYKNASKIVQKVLGEGGSIKELLYTKVRSASILRGAYALITKTVEHNALLDIIVRKCRILEENPRLDEIMAKVLITELLFGKGRLDGESRPIQTVRNFTDAIFNLYEELKDSSPTEEELQKPRYVRVNTLKATCDEVIKELRNEGWRLVQFLQGGYPEFLQTVQLLAEDQFMKDMHVRDLLVFPRGTEFFNHPLYLDSTLILQDKASCMPALVLSPTSSSTVLDMCAAPGMKTSLMAALMRGKGKLYAIERNERRYESMCAMLTAAGCANATTVHGDSLTVKEDWADTVHMILVDPSCSGTGMTEKVKFFTRPNTEERISQLSKFQFKLLHHALTSFSAAKRVVYSTCSVLCEENEKIVSDVLSRDYISNNWEVAEIMPEWPSRGSSDFPFGEKCLTARPREDLTTGFFIALFVRKSAPQDTASVSKNRKSEQLEIEAVDSQVTEEVAPNVLEESDPSHKKKKKKRKEKGEVHEIAHLPQEQTEMVASQNSEVEEEPGRKSKKRKHHDEVPPSEDVTPQPACEEYMSFDGKDRSKKSKKKKKL